MKYARLKVKLNKAGHGTVKLNGMTLPTTYIKIESEVGSIPLATVTFLVDSVDFDGEVKVVNNRPRNPSEPDHSVKPPKFDKVPII